MMGCKGVEGLLRVHRFIPTSILISFNLLFPWTMMIEISCAQDQDPLSNVVIHNGNGGFYSEIPLLLFNAVRPAFCNHSSRWYRHRDRKPSIVRVLIRHDKELATPRLVAT